LGADVDPVGPNPTQYQENIFRNYKAYDYYWVSGKFNKYLTLFAFIHRPDEEFSLEQLVVGIGKVVPFT